MPKIISQLNKSAPEYGQYREHNLALRDTLKEKLDRIAHGGEAFLESCLIDSKVISTIESCVPLAPLHNPPNLAGIRIAQKIWPDLPQVAVFDTAFHQTMPQKAITYAVPQEWRDVVLLPLLGLIIWFVAGPRGGKV